MNPLTALLLAAFAGETTEQTLTIEPDGEVEIHNVSGSVRVTTHDRPEVFVRATFGEGVEEFIARRHGAGALIRVENRKGGGGSSDLVVTVPARASVRVRVVNADVELQTGGSKLAIQTVNGDIKASTTAGHVRVQTVSGDVVLAAKSLELDISAVSADLELTADRLESLKANSVSGDLLIRTKALGAGPYSVKSQSGDVTLKIPDSVPVRVRQRSFRDSKSFGDDREDAPTFEIKSFSGDVDLERT